MKENVSPVVIAIAVILVVAVGVYFGMKTLGPSRNSEPSANQIKQHMGAGIPQSGGSGGAGRRGSPDMSGSPNMPSSGGTMMPGSGGSSGR